MPWFTEVLNQILFKSRRIRLYNIWECCNTVLNNYLAKKKFCFLFHFNYAETVVPTWPDLSPVSLDIDLMAGWIPTKSFASPLRILLGGTTLKLAPNPPQMLIFPTYRSIQRLGRLKQVTDYLSPKISDRRRLSRIDFHSL